MESTKKTTITVQVLLNAPVEKVWKYWTLPEHITKWNYASEDWHTPYAEGDLRVGGKFSSRMEAKDGSMGFDFYGFYEVVTPNKALVSLLGDGRRVTVTFTSNGDETLLVETFEAETENSIELQRGGWQAILNNFKNYTEKN